MTLSVTFAAFRPCDATRLRAAFCGRTPGIIVGVWTRHTVGNESTFPFCRSDFDVYPGAWRSGRRRGVHGGAAARVVEPVSDAPERRMDHRESGVQCAGRNCAVAGRG